MEESRSELIDKILEKYNPTESVTNKIAILGVISEISDYYNKKLNGFVLMQAEIDGLVSLLLEVQKECIELHNKIKELTQ